MIRETIVTTRSADGRVHIAPMGVQDGEGERLVLAPFRPSRSLDNMLRERCAVINCSDDVRIFAGCLTGRHDFPVCAARAVPGFHLQEALSHTEVEIEHIETDELRPRLYCRAVYQATHAPFSGFNRAQAAVIEAAILVSRLHMLPEDKVDSEIAYLQIAIDKTAGARERTAWGWLMEAVEQHRGHAQGQRA